MATWPSVNQVLLIGKVSRVRRIQWSDGSSTALVTLATQKKIATPDGFRTGHDWHECEISPGERFFGKAWEGSIVLIRGQYGSFEWKPDGAKKTFTRHVLEAVGFQPILASDREHVAPPTIMRDYKRQTAPIVKEHSHERTEP